MGNASRMHAMKIPSISSFDKLMTGSIQKGRCEKIACMVYHVIPAEAGIQDPQGDMNILDSGDPVPAKAGNRSDAKTAIFSQHHGDEEAVRQIGIPLPMEGERLEPAPDLIRGEGVQVHRFTPSPHPSPSRERELPDRLLGGIWFCPARNLPLDGGGLPASGGLPAPRASRQAGAEGDQG